MDKLVNILHITIISPLLYLLANDYLSPKQKKYIIIGAFMLAIYHFIILISKMTKTKRYIDDSVGKIVPQHQLDKYLDTHYLYDINILGTYPGFDRKEIKIKTKSIVRWINSDNDKHMIMSLNDKFNSGTLNSGDSYSVRFDKAGIYPYYCSFNYNWMRGVIYVSE